MFPENVSRQGRIHARNTTRTMRNWIQLIQFRSCELESLLHEISKKRMDELEGVGLILRSSTIDKKLENFEFIFEFKIAINFEFIFENFCKFRV